MPSYKLTYFNAKGRGEVTRQMFKYKNVEFEDNRIEGTWQEEKPKTPFGSLPVLEYDDDNKKLCQSQAIERLIAKRLGLYGKTEDEQVRTDQIVMCLEDVLQALWKATEGANDEEKAKNKKEMEEVKLPKMLSDMEKMATGDTFLGGNDLMWADFSLAHLLTFPDVLGISMDLSKYSKLSKIKAKVESDPVIEEWIKTRPASKY